LVISAAEDVGLANPNALLLANATFQSVHVIGMPEARIVLSEATVYLATSPKSNAAYTAIDEALDYVRKTGNLPVPLHLRNAPTKLMKNLGYGKDYLYPHVYPGNFVQQGYLPQEAGNTKFYEPQANAKEKEIRQRMHIYWGDKYKY
jgi:putative ATPase